MTGSSVSRRSCAPRVVSINWCMRCQKASSGVFDLAMQGGGAFVALVGIVITVAGLIGLKLYGNTGSLRQCNKGWKWLASIAGWCVGQLLQLCAVELASEPVITAVSTLAVPANALLAWKILGEPVSCTCAEMCAVPQQPCRSSRAAAAVPQPCGVRVSVSCAPLRTCGAGQLAQGPRTRRSGTRIWAGHDSHLGSSQVTRREQLAIAAMTVGAGMVVVSSPQQAQTRMTVREEAALLSASVVPAIGLFVTLLVTGAG